MKCEIYFSSPEARAAAEKALSEAGLSLTEFMQTIYAGGVDVASHTHQTAVNFKLKYETR